MNAPEPPLSDDLSEAVALAVVADEVATGQSLGQQAFRGFAWTVASSVGVKIIALGGQLTVAGLLLPKDYGLVALAYSVTAFTSILQKDGLREILVARGARFDHYANAAFWMSLATGLAVAVLTLLAAPFAAHAYKLPGLAGLLVLPALAAPLSSLQSVPGAQLQNEMRFRTMSLLNVCESLGVTTLTLLLAVAGAGPFSLLAPTPLVAAGSLVAQFRLTGFRPRWRLEWPLWRDLFGASGLMLGAAALYSFNVTGANMMLGVFRDVTTVGIYFFALNLTNQVSALLTNNLWAVLLPSLSRLQGDPARQMAAFLRVTRVVNLVGMMVCLLFAAVADPLIHLMYGDRWAQAIPVVQILAAAMTLNISFALSINLMMAQGRYKGLFWFNVWRALGFVVLVGIGAALGGAVTVAWATALFLLLFGPSITHLAIWTAGGTWKDVVGVHAWPLAISVAACGSAWLLTRACAPHAPAWLQIASTSALGVLIGLPLSWLLLPDTCRELAERVQSLRQRV